MRCVVPGAVVRRIQMEWSVDGTVGGGAIIALISLCHCRRNAGPRFHAHHAQQTVRVVWRCRSTAY
jgi:hypothetical protein